MRRIGSAVLGLSLAGFSLWGSAAEGQVPAANRAVLGAWGVDLSGMDKRVKPGDDFFRYVNGAWFDTAAIPPDRTTTGSFVQLDIQSETRVRGILAELDARSANLSPEEKQVRDLYTSYVDTERLERLGLEPARRDLAAIAALRTHDDVARAMASPELGAESIFDVRIGVDDKNPDAYAVFIRQSGLGLPDRDYYRLSEQGIVTAREKYRVYIAEILRLGGVPAAEATAKAAAIFRLESEIADIHWSRADRRDADKTYNPMGASELVQFAPDFPWASHLQESGITNPPSGERQVIISEKSAFPALASLFRRTSMDIWRDYLTFHYLSGHAVYLPKRFDEPASSSTARCSAVSASSSRVTSAACASSAARWAKMSAGSMSLVISRPMPRRKRRIWCQSLGRLPPAHSDRGLDAPGNPPPGAGEGRHVHREDRLSRHVARLFRVARRSGGSRRQSGARRAL